MTNHPNRKQLPFKVMPSPFIKPPTEKLDAQSLLFLIIVFVLSWSVFISAAIWSTPPKPIDVCATIVPGIAGYGQL